MRPDPEHQSATETYPGTGTASVRQATLAPYYFKCLGEPGMFVLRHVLELRGQGTDAREGFINAMTKHRAKVAQI